jgi:hypothetical protein
MESLIKKKQRKMGLDVDPDLAMAAVDPLVEIDRYLSQPCLRREDCPNPIPWWGVSVFVLCHVTYSTNICFLSTRPNIQFFV